MKVMKYSMIILLAICLPMFFILTIVGGPAMLPWMVLTGDLSAIALCWLLIMARWRLT